jgi:hypothetical protein
MLPSRRLLHAISKDSAKSDSEMRKFELAAPPVRAGQATWSRKVFGKKSEAGGPAGHLATVRITLRAQECCIRVFSSQRIRINPSIYNHTAVLLLSMPSCAVDQLPVRTKSPTVDLRRTSGRRETYPRIVRCSAGLPGMATLALTVRDRSVVADGTVHLRIIPMASCRH